MEKILADTVKNDYRVMDRETQHGKQSHQQIAVRFKTVEVIYDTHKAQRKNYIVNQSDDGRDAHRPRRERFLHSAKRPRDIQHYGDDGQGDGDYGAAGES